MCAASSNRQPWPMKWILLAIIALIVPYTIVTLQYRKPGPPFEPYEDMKNRANVSRLLAAGYQRIPLLAQSGSEGAPVPGGAAVANAPGGLPADLRSTLVEEPELPVEILRVTAAPTSTPGQPYIIQLTCTAPGDDRQVGRAELYLQGSDVILVPKFEFLPPDLRQPARETQGRWSIPPGALKPGRYTFTVVAERGSRAWSVEVN